MSYKKLYQHFLAGHENTLHMACHSHHFWPDVTRQAMLDYWDDSAKKSDQKWDDIFAKKIPKLQAYIARQLNLSDPTQITFAPNTHDLTVRILSSFDPKVPIKILTTDAEFHSFSRQIKRLEEDSLVQVTRVSSYPCEKFWRETTQALEQKNFDLLFMSHVFFNSGTSFGEIAELTKLVSPTTKIVIDGYHSYFALPLDLKSVEERIFFMAGHYKYAQAGEGLCFLVCPKGNERPLVTGWFAEFDALKNKSGEVAYPSHGGRFLGSTMDFSPLYRALSVYELFEREKISVDKIHGHVQQLQQRFIEIIEEIEHPFIHMKSLLHDGFSHQGHFLAFKIPTAKKCEELGQRLHNIGIHTDWRGDILRFGFALYQDLEDLERVRNIKEF